MFTAADGERQLSDSVSGVILNHETFYQTNEQQETYANVLINQGILAGIKVCLLISLQVK